MSMREHEAGALALMKELWRSYHEITPQVDRIHGLLRNRGEQIENDHVALRTYDLQPVGLDVMAEPFRALGWVGQDRYRFPDKRLRAQYFLKEGFPKVFISELEVSALPPPQQALVQGLVAQLSPGFADGGQWVTGGRPWQLTIEQYEMLAQVSEYAAWVAAHGFRANHFTVDVDALCSLSGLQELVDVLQAAGVVLNGAGGVIKGGPAVYLAQASTMADRVEVHLADGSLQVPSCYVEFAQRYRLPDGSRYEGFVPTSADRIFESTDRGSS